MLAIGRKYVAPVFMIAALAFALATHPASGASHPSGSVAACPFGTNWDVVTGTCN